MVDGAVAIATLAGLTPEDFLSFYDDRMEPLRCDEPTDAVAIPVETTRHDAPTRLPANTAGAGVPVILGGFHRV